MSATPQRPRHARAIQAPPSRTQDLSQAMPATVRGALIFVSLICLGLAAIGWTTLGRAADNLSSGGNFSLGAEEDGATDILLVGSDSRSDAQGNPLSPEEIELLRAGDEAATNTDTIMVIRVPSDGTSATAISIPRDTYISTPALGNVKINGVYGLAKEARAEQLGAEGRSPEEVEQLSTEAGRRALIDAIDDLTGIAVDHYAEVGLLGFVLLTDAVGGVDVCLNAPVYDEFSGADFTAGRQTLNGADALSFVRQRHGLPRGDLDRITRQQAFMASFANKLLSAGTLSNPSRLNELGGAVRRSVVLDDEWDVMGFATQMQGLTGGNVIFDTIPVTSIDGIGDHGESVVTVDKGQVHKYFEKLLHDDAKNSSEAATPVHSDFTASDVTVSVFNATFTDGLAGRVSDLISKDGFAAGDVANAEYTGVTMSQVNATDTGDPAARAIATKLGGLPVVYDPSLSPGNVSVTLAGDYNGPGLYSDEAPDSEVAEESGEVVGQEGGAPAPEPTTEPIDAGGDGPMCVN